MSGTYTKEGDYLLLNLILLEEEPQPISIWRQQSRRYLKQHHKIPYYNLLTSEKLNAHLTGIGRQSEEIFSQLVNQEAKRGGVTEHLKAENQIKWVRRMNNTRNRAAEIVYADIRFK